MRREALLIAALAVVSPRPAEAVVLSEDVFGERATEVGAIVRSFLFNLFGDILAPPLSAEDADPSAAGIFDVRLYGRYKTPSFNFVVHNQLTAAVRSHGGLGPLPLGRSVAPPRLLPLSFDATDQATLQLASTTDWLYASYVRGRATLTVGRQPVTFGRGKLWAPTDLVGTFALTEVDTEYKPGADAVRFDYSRGDQLTVTAVASTGELESAEHDFEADLEATTILGRAAFGLDDGELAVLAAFVRGDAVLGVDGTWDVAGFDLYGEATATLVTGESLASPEADDGDVVPKAVVGATWRRSTLTLSPELIWNGFGSTDAADYVDVAQSPRVAIGEQTTLGRFYAGATAAWELHSLIQVGGATLVNLVDPSALLSATISYNIARNVMLAAGGYVPIGSEPSLAPAAAESEYGLYPYFFFAHFKAVI